MFFCIIIIFVKIIVFQEGFGVGIILLVIKFTNRLAFLLNLYDFIFLRLNSPFFINYCVLNHYHDGLMFFHILLLLVLFVFLLIMQGFIQLSLLV